MLLAVVKQMGGFLERGTMKWKVLANRKGRGNGFQQLKQQLSCVGAWGPVRVRSEGRAVEACASSVWRTRPSHHLVQETPRPREEQTRSWV